MIARLISGLCVLGMLASISVATAADRAKANVDCRATDQSLVYICMIMLTGRKSDAPIEGAKVVVGADMPSMPMVHNVKPVTAMAADKPGTYHARIELEMYGEWALRLDVSGPLRDRLIHKANFADPKSGNGHAAKLGAMQHDKMDMAAGHKIGPISISNIWARASAGHAKNGAAYLTISTEGAEMDKLVGLATPVAKKAELHTHLMENNVMKMRRIDAIEVHPGEPSVFAPGGNHIMLMGLHKPLKEGESFTLTLNFATAGSVDVTVIVGKVGSMQAPAHHGKSHGKMKMN